MNAQILPATLEIEVTQDDINTGKPCTKSKCAIALAIKRKFPEYELSVSHREFVIGLYIDRAKTYKMPPEAGEFIRAFDNPMNWDHDGLNRGPKGCEPFTFTATEE